MGQILRDAGLRVDVRKYSVRVEEDANISFEHYGGDLGEPSVEAFADSKADVLRDVEKVSTALACAGVVHRFTVYDEGETAIAYFHHQLPRDEVV